MVNLRSETHWFVALMAGMVLGALVGLGHFLVFPPKYAATAVCVISPRNEATALDTLSGIRWAQALSRLTTQEQIVTDELTEAGLPDMARQPREFIAAVAAPDTSVFTVTVRDSERHRALRGAVVVSGAVSRFAQQSNVPVQVTTGGAAAEATPAPGLSTRLILGAAAGLGLAIIIVLSLLDARRWPAETGISGQAAEVERMNGSEEQ